MTTAPGISLHQDECTKLKKVTIKGTFQSREQIQQVLMCTHFTDFCDFTLFLQSGQEEDIVLAPIGNARGSCKRPYITEPTTLSNTEKVSFTRSQKGSMVKSLVQGVANWRVNLHHLNHET